VSSVACLTVQYFSTVSHKRHNIRKKKLFTIKMCVLIFSTLLSDIFLVLRRTDKDMIKNLHWSSYKVPNILDTFYWNLNFLDWYTKNTRIPNFGKIRPVRAVCSTRTEGRTDGSYEPNRLFSQFCEPALQRRLQ